jgi:hypothetical protein
MRYVEVKFNFEGPILLIRYFFKSARCKSSPFVGNFVWQIQLSLLYKSLFKVNTRKYLSKGNCEFIELLFVILDKINFSFVNCLFASPISAYAVPGYI